MSAAEVSQPSASALNVARCRAIAAHESRAAIRGQDHLAEVFLGAEAQASLQNPAIHAVILKKLDAFSPGSYEYFIARTAYLDHVVAEALRADIPQVVFLGAGYDTRAYRFRDRIQHTRIFELDSAATQQHKRALLDQAGVAIPEQVAFVTIDFVTERLADRLTAAGYAQDQPTLFIWEGVSYYLPLAAVDETLCFVRHQSGPGSVLCFDYMPPAADLEGRFGAQQARAAMQATYTAEPLHFDLAEAAVSGFLAERGFSVVEHLTAAQMQMRYLLLDDGTPAGPILDLFGLVQARVNDPSSAI